MLIPGTSEMRNECAQNNGRSRPTSHGRAWRTKAWRRISGYVTGRSKGYNLELAERVGIFITLLVVEYRGLQMRKDSELDINKSGVGLSQSVERI